MESVIATTITIIKQMQDVIVTHLLWQSNNTYFNEISVYRTRKKVI